MSRGGWGEAVELIFIVAEFEVMVGPCWVSWGEKKEKREEENLY